MVGSDVPRGSVVCVEDEYSRDAGDVVWDFAVFVSAGRVLGADVGSAGWVVGVDCFDFSGAVVGYYFSVCVLVVLLDVGLAGALLVASVLVGGVDFCVFFVAVGFVDDLADDVAGSLFADWAGAAADDVEVGVAVDLGFVFSGSVGLEVGVVFDFGFVDAGGHELA